MSMEYTILFWLYGICVSIVSILVAIEFNYMPCAYLHGMTLVCWSSKYIIPDRSQTPLAHAFYQTEAMLMLLLFIYLFVYFNASV